MSSPETEARVRRSSGGGVFRLLDAMLGLMLWAGHLLIVYIGAATACVLQLGAENADARTALRVVLALVTVAAAGLVALHAYRRYRRQRHDPDERFRMSVTIGCDAIAIVAILWQLFPIWLVPVCA